MQTNFFPGAIRDVLDERDFQWQEVGFTAAPFDWSAGYDIEVELAKKLSVPTFKIPVKDQNGSGSCGGQAWSYYDSVFEAMATGSFEERSARFIYSQTFVAPDGGSDGRTNSILVADQGVAREVVFTSYNNGHPPSESFMRNKSDMTADVKADANKSRAKGYANVNNDIDTFAQAIRENYGLVLGIDGEDNGTWLSPFPKPPSKRVWGHWLYAGKAKLIDGKKYIGVINSWGASTGDQGIQWLGEDYFKSGHIWYGWTQVFDPASLDTGFHYTFKNQLDFGAIGADVVALQTALKLEGCFPSYVPATGLFGLITQASVKAFQKKYNLDQVGRVGPKTLAQLNKLYS